MLFGLTLGRDGFIPGPTHVGITESNGCGSCHAHPFWLFFSITVGLTKFVEAISGRAITPAASQDFRVGAVIASAAARSRASTFTDAMSESVNPSRSMVLAVSMPNATSSARTATETNDL